jgi:hypothetical protein
MIAGLEIPSWDVSGERDGSVHRHQFLQAEERIVLEDVIALDMIEIVPCTEATQAYADVPASWPCSGSIGSLHRRGAEPWRGSTGATECR